MKQLLAESKQLLKCLNVKICSVCKRAPCKSALLKMKGNPTSEMEKERKLFKNSSVFQAKQEKSDIMSSCLVCSIIPFL